MTRILSCIAIFCLDRLTKSWALARCQVPYIVTSWCHGSLTFNTGVAWSLGDTLPSSIICSIMMLALVGMYCVSSDRYRSSQGTVLILSGALSNLLDRLLYGGVVDFIVLHYRNWYYPTFNVADIAICCGAFLLLWERE